MNLIEFTKLMSRVAPTSPFIRDFFEKIVKEGDHDIVVDETDFIPELERVLNYCVRVEAHATNLNLASVAFDAEILKESIENRLTILRK